MIVSAYIAGIGGRFTGLRPGDYERLTHVNFAFARVKSGKASVDHWFDTESADAKVRELMQNKGHLKVLLSIGGWGAGGFSPACETAEGRKILSESFIKIVNDYGFDGVDLDWEYPAIGWSGIEAKPEDVQNYTSWVEMLREMLGPDMLITMACGGARECVDNLELNKLVPIMDMFNLMTYDLCNHDRTSHHTSLFPSDLCKTKNAHDVVDLYIQAGVPKEKITIGSGFYARVYRDVDGMDMPTTENSGPHPGWSSGYKQNSEFAEKTATGLQYDKKAEAAWAYNAETRELYTFDNERSVRAKRNYCINNGLAGVMFWEYNCDDDTSPLLKALTGNLTKKD